MPVDFRRLTENCVGLKMLPFKVSLDLQVFFCCCSHGKQVNKLVGESDLSHTNLCDRTAHLLRVAKSPSKTPLRYDWCHDLLSREHDSV